MTNSLMMWIIRLNKTDLNFCMGADVNANVNAKGDTLAFSVKYWAR